MTSSGERKIHGCIKTQESERERESPSSMVGGRGSMSIIRQLDQLADRAANNEKNNRPDFKRNMKINIVRPTFV